MTRTAPPCTPSGAVHLPRLTDRFRITAELAGGADGRVFLADDLQSGEPVALKLAVDTRGAALATEARVLGHLGRLGVGAAPRRVAWLALPDARRVLVSERLMGHDLRSLRAAGGNAASLDRDRVSRICLTLASVHEADVIHGDLKPEHVWLAPGGEVRLLDFGAAVAPTALAAAERLVHAPVAAAWPGPARSPTPDDGLDGGLVGSFAYLAPERFRGQPASVAADLYALGATLLDAAGGLPDTRDDAPHHWSFLHGCGTLARWALQCSKLEPVVAALLARCLDPDPWRRPADARDAAELLAPSARLSSAAPRRRLST